MVAAARAFLSPHLALPGPELSLAELEALRGIDEIAPPEVLEELRQAPLFPPRSPGSGDQLRLPPPPFRAATGYALFSSLGNALERFELSRSEPIVAKEQALIAEARMNALLRGIHGLEAEIRGHIARARRT